MIIGSALLQFGVHTATLWQAKSTFEWYADVNPYTTSVGLFALYRMIVLSFQAQIYLEIWDFFDVQKVIPSIL